MLDTAIAKAGGLATLIMHAVFNDAAMPEGFMERFGQAVNFANWAAGDWSIGNGAGPVDQKSAKEKAEDDNEDALEAAGDSAERIDRQREMQATISQSALDAMAWEGDQNAVWSFGGKQGSRKSWYDAAKAVRQRLPQVAEENGWDDDTRAHQEKLLSDYMKALKTNDEKAAQEAYRQMEPGTQHAIDLTHEKMSVEAGISHATVQAASTAVDASQNAQSTQDLLAAASEGGPAKPVKEMPTFVSTSESRSGLTNPPNINLTEHHQAAIAATVPLDNPSAGSAPAGPVKVAEATPIRTPGLSADISL